MAIDEREMEYLLEKVKEAVNGHDVVEVTISSNKFANKLDLTVSARERLTPLPQPDDGWRRG